MLMHKSPPSCSPLEQALRKYPSVVEHRSQNEVRSDGDKEFKNERSFSIPPLYSNVKDSSTIICTPVIYIKAPQLEYPGMGEDSVVEVRRARLKRLIEDRYRGIQANMVRDTGINAGELSGLLKTRFFGEKKARLIERTLDLPDRWLDGADVEINTALDDFKWILWNATESEKSILLATVDAIRSAYRDSSSIEELKPLIERRRRHKQC